MRCPRCTSRLIYPVVVGDDHRGVLLRRRCPECELIDWVVVTVSAAEVWLDDEQRLVGEVAALADALAGGLPIDPSEAQLP